MEFMFCSNCGAKNDPEANFCRACGCAQSLADAEAPIEVAANGRPQDTGGVTAVLDAPVTTALVEPARPTAALPSATSGRSRPSWLLPALLAGALALLGLIGAIVFSSRGHP